MPTIRELQERRALLDAEIQRLQRATRTENLARLKSLMAEAGLTVSDLTRKVPAKVPAKYADGVGNSWSGRGLKPVWLREKLAAGATLESFAVAPK